MSGLHKNISNARLIAAELKGAVNLGDLIKTDGGWFFFYRMKARESDGIMSLKAPMGKLYSTEKTAQ